MIQKYLIAIIAFFIVALPVQAKESQNLTFYNVNTRETLIVHPPKKTDYTASEVQKLSRFLRDKRTGQAHKVDPRLVTLIYKAARKADFKGVIEVVCGYRSPATNSMRSKQSKSVGQDSYHVKGQAIDLRFKGIGLTKLREIVENLKKGGVGFYPHDGFIHIDTGPVRKWRG